MVDEQRAQRLEPSNSNMTGQLCSINAMFVAASDDEAIAIKRAVTEALLPVKMVRFTFTLSDVPQQGRMMEPR